MRDSQRSKVYKAEEAFYRASGRLETVWAIEHYVNLLKSNQALKVKYGQYLEVPIRVKDGRGNKRASAHRNFIVMPVWARYEGVVLHELAHVINIRKYYSRYINRTIAGHGWEFCEVYLTLVYHMMGKEAYETLKKSFKAHGVKYKEKVVRDMPEAQKEALRARMAQVRAMRGNNGRVALGQ
jgi:putative metallohydrolase (TIGR04338 family)